MTFPLSNQWTDGEELNATKMNARIDAMLNLLAASQAAFPLGSVGHNTLASPVTGITTATTLATVNVSVVAGRKYGVTAYFEGTQVTTTGILNVELKIAGAHAAYAWFLSTAPSTVYGAGNALYIPGSSASVAFALTATTSAGSLSVNAGAFVLVEDLGTT